MKTATLRQRCFAEIHAEMGEKFPAAIKQRKGRLRRLMAQYAQHRALDWRKARMRAYSKYGEVMRLLERYDVTINLETGEGTVIDRRAS